MQAPAFVKRWDPLSASVRKPERPYRWLVQQPASTVVADEIGERGAYFYMMSIRVDHDVAELVTDPSSGIGGPVSGHAPAWRRSS
jgi:hypothetical protein